MTNHIHLISVPQQASSLYLTMRDVLGPYASYFNHKYGFTGRLWQGRFYSTVLDETHFWAAIRYVERNPVRAGMVARAEEYLWSAAADHCTMRQDPLLTKLTTIPAFIRDWSDWLAEDDDALEMKRIRTTTKTGSPCGSTDFVEELELIMGVKFRVREPGRPKGGNQARRATLPFPR